MLVRVKPLREKVHVPKNFPCKENEYLRRRRICIWIIVIALICMFVGIGLYGLFRGTNITARKVDEFKTKLKGYGIQVQGLWNETTHLTEMIHLNETQFIAKCLELKTRRQELRVRGLTIVYYYDAHFMIFSQDRNIVYDYSVRIFWSLW